MADSEGISVRVHEPLPIHSAWCHRLGWSPPGYDVTDASWRYALDASVGATSCTNCVVILAPVDATARYCVAADATYAE